ncbi:hypothetical protein ACTA71_008711 [Dictyostelium dimigraforme]
MKLLSILLLISSFVGFIQSQYLLVETTFSTQDCSSSSSSYSPTSSLLSISPSLFTTSFQEFQPTGGSLNENSLLESCPYNPSGGKLIKPGICVQMENSSAMVYLAGDRFTYEVYDTDSCQDSPTYVIDVSGACKDSGCLNGYRVFTKYTIVSYPITPNNILLSATYTGKCNGNYKNSLIYLNYQHLDFCEPYPGFGLDSFQVSCNSTTATATVYTEPGSNCGGRNESFYFPIANSCGHHNIFQECQIG